MRCLPRLAIAVAVASVLTLATIPARGDDKPDAIKPFKIAVDDAVLRDLKERLGRTRFPDQVPDTGWDHGVDLGYMKDLVTYWKDKYDWRAEERKLNAIPQFVTEIDGLSIHFMHIRSKEKNALPLVMVHGWPGSFAEFLKVIGPLTDPVAHGGKAGDAFDVVCPSLPGFGFSSKPKERGWNSQRMAEVIAKLMARLGYERYGAQGGDWGGGIVRWMTMADARCLGAHNNFPSGSRPTEDPMRGVTPEETRRLEKRQLELRDHYAYAAIQGTRPLTLGYGLNDSPAGLAAWVIDKFWAWSDHGGKLESKFTKEELLTNVMVYWVTETMPSSARIYYESGHPSPKPKSMTEWKGRGVKPAPIGFALFPKEINVPPRAWVERAIGPSMVHWTEMPRGGHFAAMEEPELLVGDVRKFFSTLR